MQELCPAWLRKACKIQDPVNGEWVTITRGLIHTAAWLRKAAMPRPLDIRFLSQQLNTGVSPHPCWDFQDLCTTLKKCRRKHASLYTAQSHPEFSDIKVLI